MIHGSGNILTLSNTQAKELAGRVVTIGTATYSFQGYDPKQPGQPPWRTGAEGKAYPLLGEDGSIAAYLKFFTFPTKKRLDRTAWLIGQQMHRWLPHLAAAPVLWTDTRRGLRGAKIDFQFAAYLAKAVPGETWLERKSGIANGKTPFPEELRWRCVTDLLLGLAALEQAELVHGDLSPNNVIIDLAAPPDHPALYLIDFDAFFAPAAGANQAVSVAEGGTYGTEGYCPPEVAAAVSAGDGSVAPYSDRYGRDMLLLEFLLMDSGLPSDDPLAHWSPERVQRQFAAWQARSDPKRVEALGHLDPATVFKVTEPERPTSVDLASGLGLSLPERRMLRRVTQLPRPTPAILGYRPTTAEIGRAFEKLDKPSRWRLRSYAITPKSVLAEIAKRSQRGWRSDLWIRLVMAAMIFLILSGFLVAINLAMREERPTARSSADGNQETATREERPTAAADYTEAIVGKPDFVEGYRGRAVACDDTPELNAAIADYLNSTRQLPKADAIALERPVDAEAYCSRGAVHLAQHDFKNAIADFTEAIHLEWWLIKAYLGRGSAYRAQGDEIKAQEDFDQAMMLKHGEQYTPRQSTPH